jgi:hypothetical protein
VRKVKENTNIEIKVKETSDECKIVIINKLYSERYKKILCYYWLTTNIPKQPKTNKRLGSHKFPQARLNCGLKFTSTTYTISIDDNLVRANFHIFMI